MSAVGFTTDVQFYKSDGTKLEDKQPLVLGTTYYCALGGDAAPWGCMWWKYDAAIVITSIAIESINVGHPDKEGGTDFYGGAHVYEAGNANWTPEALVPVVSVAGGTAASQEQALPIGGQRRYRAVIVIGATGGKLRGRPHHKE